MTRRPRSLTGRVITTGEPQTSALTFPANLIHPPQSQVTRSEDAVSNRITQLDMWAQKLGEGFGIPFTTFVMNPLPNEPRTGAEIAVVLLGALVNRAERVCLERRNGKWGLYFTREPAAFAQDRSSQTSPLRDAPLDIREKFLTLSEEFFRQYLKLCEDRLGTMKKSVDHADRTLGLLSQLRLE